MKHPIVCLALVVAGLVIGAPTLVAQEDPHAPTQRLEAMRAVAYTLENANPEEAGDLLAGLFAGATAGGHGGVRITSDPRTNTVLVFGPDSIHRHIRDLIATIDLQVGPANSGQETRIITLKHQSVHALGSVVRMHGVQSTENSATNSFVVRGSTGEIDRLAATLAALDVPARSVQLACWILEHGKGASVAEDRTLAPLAPELARAGHDDYGVLSHTSVTTLAGQQFESSQRLDQRRVDGLQMNGTVRLVDGGKTAHVDLYFQVAVELDGANELDPRIPTANFTLQTSLQTQPGKLVVVGLAPTGDENSKPLILVLRIAE